MKTAEEYVALAESELEQRGGGGDGDRAVARAGVFAALAAVAQAQPIDATEDQPLIHPGRTTTDRPGDTRP